MENLEREFSTLAGLIGEKARAVMLWNLLDGRAYTATELAICADVSAQSASNHLSKLIQANILQVKQQGKHRYYSFSNPEVASVIESMAGLLSLGNEQREVKRTLPQPGLRLARTCYDHLAGKLGVEMSEAMLQKGFLTLAHQQYEVTTLGLCWFNDLEIDVTALHRQKRCFARPCLDWSERRPHLAGALGAAILQIMLEKDWVRKVKNSRALLCTAKGQKALKQSLGIEF